MKNAAEIIKAEIAAAGAISFARFMELALYCPGSGYYEKETDTIGRGGDFYTSVSVGTLFGELLAFQFSQWRKDSIRPEGAGPFQIVEAGAHHGQLARDILGALAKTEAVVAAPFEYWIVEPSEQRQAKQQKTLSKFADKVHWTATLAGIPGGVHGVIFSNELLDAMPVHRFGWDAKGEAWYEWGVAWEGGQFIWTRLKEPPALVEVPPELLHVLPDGFTFEASPAATEWWWEAARLLKSGKLLTFDYGVSAEEFLSPARKDGTVRAYYRHHVTADVLANPGEQDITAHVNFGAIQAAGESVGLRTESVETQAKFLTTIAGRAWEKENDFGPWTVAHTRQFQTLTHPEHLGRAFRVLVQAR